jgi:hypothetical protein
MGRKVSKAQFMAVAMAPKRRYLNFTVSGASQAKLSKPVAAPCFWFEQRREIINAEGEHILESREATITLVVDGTPSVLFYLDGRDLVSCTFAFRLAPHQLATAVTAMKKAKLRRLIPMAASSALENMPEESRSALESDLRRLASTGKRTRSRT